jgi:hypothetical protein
MNCPFCKQEMYFDGDRKSDLLRQYSCNNLNCMVNNDFPRYLCGTDKENKLCWEEYALGGFYVKVSTEGSTIFQLTSCILNKEVMLPESLWLNPTNLGPALDRLAALHYIIAT